MSLGNEIFVYVTYDTDILNIITEGHSAILFKNRSQSSYSLVEQD